MKLRQFAPSILLLGFVVPAFAQTTPPPDDKQKIEKVIVTGSSIKRIENEGALPLQIITKEEMERQGIVSTEQLIASLTSNGNSTDNLASNGDVVTGAQRGNNGSSAANLRGQGASATLILLNGRRIAAYGLNGGIVDLGSIPLAAVERVEVLKDGASAIYGTDAVGGVINFILKKDFQGLSAQVFADRTQLGGANIYRGALVGGIGDLGKDRYNFMASASFTDSERLMGYQRTWLNTFQSDRGLSVDTRGTPFATVFPLASNNAGVLQTILTSRTTPTSPLSNTVYPLIPGTTLRDNQGINPLNLPGGAGCNSIDGQQAYDYKLWANPAALYACAWDTGRAAAILQPIKNSNIVARSTFAFGEHTVYAELTAGRSTSHKIFSNQQISSSTSTTSPLYNLVYPLNANTTATYNAVFNALVAVFPSIQENYGKGIAYRWRCMICGPRNLDTTATNARLLLAAEGVLGNWDYRVGASKAYSDSKSVIGDGYFYNDKFVPLLASGLINPFLPAGQSQSAAALTAYQAASAKGATLYGGRFELSQGDASISGSLFHLPAGDMMGAVGTDVRRETWKFDGNNSADANNIFNAPFDNGNQLGGVSRDIRAFYGELIVPVFKSLEVTLAARNDHYTGFGGTTNPKVSFRFVPIEELLFRGSYNTGFRVPTFNQLFNGASTSPTSGTQIVDPKNCPSLIPTSSGPCASINPTTTFGGVSTLGPEKAKQALLGVVWAPTHEFSVGVDWWSIHRTDTIQSLAVSTVLANYSLFANRFTRDANGVLTDINISWLNAGETSTKGLELSAKLNGKVWNGSYFVNLDGEYLLEKKSKLVSSQPWGPSEIAVFTRAGDLGIRWKHNLTVTYKEGDWSTSVVQQYRSAYMDQILPGVLNGTVTPPNWNPTVQAYQLYHMSVSYTGFKNLTLTGGIRNLFNTDPPFTVFYDSNLGGGADWEPRVADPRGRSFTLLATYTFK